MTTTPPPPRSRSRARSTSRSRPTTPLRPSSRSSFRDSARGSGADEFPLNAFEPAFGELADAMADLEANLHHFRIMHESLKRFGESFAAFLYGLEVNAFCVDFPEAPVRESWGLARAREELGITAGGVSRPASRGGGMTLEDLGGTTGRKALGTASGAEETFMTTDVSFVDNPSTASKPKFETPAPKRGSSRPSRMPAPAGRGRAGTGSARGRGGTRPSGIARASSGIARASSRGRGVRRT